MSTLSRDLRRVLERTVNAARRVAEEGSRKALDHLAVSHHEHRGHLTPDQRKLRNRLRARARQLDDPRDVRGFQAIDRLVEQCAYEQWHRILFARFLADNHLLIHPPTGQAISLEECRELAADQGKEWLTLASEYAVGMLPQVFRADDAVLEVTLPAESCLELERLLETLPVEVFTASDSLGWTYQFWQAEQKDAINASGRKIGAAEMGPVTQLFTEDYMVEFLLHNTLGAWWAGKQGPIRAESEEEARARVVLPAWNGLPAVTWDYLRFLKNDDGTWRPAAGSFDGWPRVAAEVTMLDPSMGSGHFLVFALPILARIRAEEEALHPAAAVVAALRDNLHGLELDERCTQIAAFNLALAAWRMARYQALPPLHLACSGLNLSAGEKEWVALAKGDTKLEEGMRRLHQLFAQAPVLGSLIDPRSEKLDLMVADYQDLVPLLERAVAASSDDAVMHERAVTAQGLAKAAELLTQSFTLVATNVPYLGRSLQISVLQEYAQRRHGRAKADLATCFLERCLAFARGGGCAAVVTPQHWLYLGSYRDLRKFILTETVLHAVGRLGTHAFATITGEVVNALLAIVSLSDEVEGRTIWAVDASARKEPSEKAEALILGESLELDQHSQLANPDGAIVLGTVARHPPIGMIAMVSYGSKPGQTERVIRYFWELPAVVPQVWRLMESTPNAEDPFSGKSKICLSQDQIEAQGIREFGVRGSRAWGNHGIIFGKMSRLPAAWYLGEFYDDNTYTMVAKDPSLHLALGAYTMSPEFANDLRLINQKLNVTRELVEQLPFDQERWIKAANDAFPGGAPLPSSADPTQWLFAGQPEGASHPLVVAVCRMVGYHWPRHTSSTVAGCATHRCDDLEEHEDTDGIVCLPALHKEQSAAVRLRGLLATAFGIKWNALKEHELLGGGGVESSTLESLLEEEFFEQHCALFHQRPFVWQIWDGVRGGFSALVNYHKLAAPTGGGRRTLEKLTHTYLGDWITRQRADVAAGADGAELRLAAALHLKDELEKILEGEPPYDIFVRWKRLHEQPIGWDPDINDGVRVNIRPFMTARPYNARGKNACILRYSPRIKWDKDRGKEPERPREDYPWFWGWDGSAQDFMGGKTFDGHRWNDLHYSRAIKEAAREAAAHRCAENAK